MQLYLLPRHSKFKIIDEDVKIPPDASLARYDVIYSNPRLDGMYCNCTDVNGVVYYFAAWTEVEEIKDA